MLEWLVTFHSDKMNKETDSRKRIGSKITQLRMMRGISVDELSDQSNISPSNLSRIEAGRYNVSIDVLADITDSLNAEIEFSVYD